MEQQTPLAAYKLRHANPSDTEWLIDLRTKTMTGHLKASGYQVSHEKLEQRVLQDFESIRIISTDNQAAKAIGMIKVVRESHCWSLIQIQLLPDFQGLGIGSALIRAILTEARQCGVPVKLSVLKVNPAKSLYARLGFRAIAETTRSYEMIHTDCEPRTSSLSMAP